MWGRRGRWEVGSQCRSIAGSVAGNVAGRQQCWVVVAFVGGIVRVPNVDEFFPHPFAKETPDSGIVQGLRFQTPEVGVAIAISPEDPRDGVRISNGVACERHHVTPHIVGKHG